MAFSADILVQEGWEKDLVERGVKQHGGGRVSLQVNGRGDRGRDMQGTALLALDRQHKGTPCLFCCCTCTLTLHFCKRNPWEAKPRTKRWNKTMLTRWKWKQTFSTGYALCLRDMAVMVGRPSMEGSRNAGTLVVHFLSARPLSTTGSPHSAISCTNRGLSEY